jgi:hypothetical protein
MNKRAALIITGFLAIANVGLAILPSDALASLWSAYQSVQRPK